MDFSHDEHLIAILARMLKGVGHVAVGVASPIPGSASLLARELSQGTMRVSILGSGADQAWSDSGVEMFDCAAQGRIDAFFFGGGQIDGQANINLVGIGDYPRHRVRWAGSFGSAYLYFLVPRVILFRQEHTRRVLVPNVDFISAPGTSDANVHRPGGPTALVTDLCRFSFDAGRRRFRLESVHPGHSVEEVRDNTGFDFDMAEPVTETPAPTPDALELIRGPVARTIAHTYPVFAGRVFGIAEGAAP
ncbi:MAG: CoA-transferase [Rhodospirillales bacterium]|jgi:glutaconate CoA-transferase subunit B|nr:CoA-transferase [Rhodospirillales bacterium]MDP6883710.1 CoA-transferase [Rhodospirillales bacterium]